MGTRNQYRMGGSQMCLQRWKNTLIYNNIQQCNKEECNKVIGLDQFLCICGLYIACKLEYSPDSATSDIGTPCSCDIKPKMEKIAKPATKLVPLLRKQRAMQSLPKEKDTFDITAADITR